MCHQLANFVCSEILELVGWMLTDGSLLAAGKWIGGASFCSNPLSYYWDRLLIFFLVESTYCQNDIPRIPDAMDDLSELLADKTWKLTFAYDPNHGGDGARFQLFGDTHSFRRLAALLTLIADKVDDKDHPSSEYGWHLGFNPSDMQQFELLNASVLTLNCSPLAPKCDDRF